MLHEARLRLPTLVPLLRRGHTPEAGTVYIQPRLRGERQGPLPWLRTQTQTGQGRARARLLARVRTLRSLRRTRHIHSIAAAAAEEEEKGRMSPGNQWRRARL